MDRTLTDDAWSDARTRLLAADEGWQPDATAAGLRFQQRRSLPRRSRQRTMWLIAAAATVVLVIFLLPATRAAAQRLWTMFRVQRTAAVRVRPGSPALQLKSFRLELLNTPTGPTVVPSAARAERFVGFVPRLSHSPALGTPTLTVTGEVTGQLTIDRPELQLALAQMRIPVVVPEAWHGATIRFHQGGAVTATWPNLTLMQVEPPTVSVPAGLDLQAYAVVALRIAGVGQREAQRMASRFETLPAMVAVEPEDEVAEVLVGTMSGTIIRDFSKGRTLLKRTLLWSAPDRLFVLVGDAGCDDCGYITDEFLIDLANSVR